MTPIILPPISPADAGWEEVYGPDWPWFNAAADMPAIQNSLCRVFYDTAHQPGLRVDLWDGTNWTQQGKLTFWRNDASVGGAGLHAIDTLVSSGLVEYTPDRAVIWAVMRASGDPLSRARVYVTIQRGWSGPRIEVYEAKGADGLSTNVTVGIYHTVPLADANDSATAIDAAATGAIVATAGSGSTAFTTASVGAGTFTGENWVHLLRQAQPFAATFAALQAPAGKNATSDAGGFGTARNAIDIGGALGAYQSVHLGFYATVADQIMEAEAIRVASGTTSQVADASASGGQCVKDTQITEAHNTLVKSPTNLTQAKYRLSARCKVDGGTGSFRGALTGAATGVVKTTTSTSWTWLDLGEFLPTGASPVFAANAWRSAGGSGSAYIDRVELVKLEDRVRPSAPFDGARDLGQSVLYDSRVELRRVARG